MTTASNDPRTMDRADLEMAIIEHDILPTDAAGCDAIGAMGDEELRAVVLAWIEAGDECAAS
jgi:hypothetical protein